MTHTRLGWQAPTVESPVVGTVPVPGSKSLTNRALILAAQARDASRLVAPLRSRDTELMAAGLRALGVHVRDAAGVDQPGATASGADDCDWLIDPAPLTGPAVIDCGLAGTVMRFLPPLASTATGTVEFDGDPHARTRPMRTVLDALRGLGARIEGDGLPFRLDGSGTLRGGRVAIDAAGSSQFVSGLLLSAPRYGEGVTVVHTGAPVPSMPHIEMTVAVLRSVGVQVDDSIPDTWQVNPGPVAPWSTAIEPDLSNATPFLAAAAVTGGRVEIPHWPATTTQAGDHIRQVLTAMGCLVELSDQGVLRVQGPDRLVGIEVDLHDASELTPTIAAMAVLADGPTRLSGIGHIRGHETDRLAALARNITALGGRVVEEADALQIVKGVDRGGEWPAYADHRMATAGAVIGLVIPGVVVDDIDSTAKTLPQFAAMWAALVAGADRPE